MLILLECLPFCVTFMLLFTMTIQTMSWESSLKGQIRKIDVLRHVMKGFEKSLTTLLSCVNEPRPLQATVVAAVDLPRPWSIAALVQAASIPVVTALNYSSRGFAHIVSLDTSDLVYNDDISVISDYFRNAIGTNPLGIFIIMYIGVTALTETVVRDINKAFFQALGTTRVFHLYPDLYDPHVYFSDSHDTMKDEWIIEKLYLSDFCKVQLDGHTQILPLSSNVRQLKGLRFEFVLREQNVWLDRRNNSRFGGRDFMFANLLMEEFGMQWVYQENGSLYDKFRKGTMDLALPLSSIATFWKFSYLDTTEYTVVSEQSDDMLVVRRAARIPFGLVLVLPFEWDTWIVLVSTLVLVVPAWTLVLNRRFQISNTLFVVLDLIEILLTGGTSRTIFWTSQRMIVICVIILHILAGNSYTGLLLGFLTVPKHFKELDTIRDTVATTDRLYAVESNSYDFRYHFQGMPWLIQKEVIFIGTTEQRYNCVQDIVHTGTAAALMGEKLYDVISRYKKYTVEGRIMLHKVKEPLRSPNFQAYPVRRNHFIIHVLNNLILRLMQSGLFDYWERTLVFSLDLDGQRDINFLGGDEEPETLRIVQLSGPFLLWGGGLCLAGIAFLFEQIRRRSYN